MRVCRICKKSKHLDNYSKNKSIADGFNTVCKECDNKMQSKKQRSFLGLITRMYGNQCTNSKRRNHPLPDYSLVEFKEWILRQDTYKELYDKWVESNYDRFKAPSCDRINPKEHYTLSNLRLTVFADNKHKGEMEVRYMQVDNCTLLNGGHTSVVQKTKTGNIVAIHISQAEAARVTGADQANISSCCKGKLKSHKGFKWEYFQNGQQNQEK